MSFLWGYPDIGKSVVAGPLRECVRVGARLEQACFLFPEGEGPLSGGFAEHMGNRIMLSFAIPRGRRRRDHNSDRELGCTVCPGRGRG